MVTLLIATIAALPQDAEWEYRPGVGFVDRKTQVVKTPKEFYELGFALAQERRTDEALAIFNLILKHAPEPELVELTKYRKGETLWSGSRFAQAYQECDDFLRLYPESAYAQKAKRLAMESAFLLAQEGQAEMFLGILPLSRTADPGINLLRSVLQRYPREPFTSLYYYKLAKFLVDDEQLDKADNEIKFILSEYKDTVEAPKAILLRGEIGLLKFDAIDYDIRGLQDARRYFTQFVDEAAVLARISPDAADYVKEKLPYAKEKIAFLNEMEAEKEYRTAEYYRSKDKFRAAKMYYESILKLYPQTTWAAKAQERLKELQP